MARATRAASVGDSPRFGGTMRTVTVAVLSIAALLSAPLGGSTRSAPERLRLPDGALTGIIGGVGAAQTDVSLPRDVIKSNLYSLGSSAAWDQGGARCEYACSQGGANTGFSASVPIIAILTGATAPVFEVSSDGVLKARTVATFSGTVNGFDLYSASLQTKCIGGPRAGQLCSSSWVCGNQPDANPPFDCRAQDQTGSYNSCATDPMGHTVCQANGPCGFSVCSGYTSAPGQFCVTAADCPNLPPFPNPPFAPTCVASTLQGSAHTCYALQNCGTGSGGCTDCRTNGAGLTPSASGNNKFMHTVRARVLVPAAGTPGNTVAVSERVFQYVQGDSPLPKKQCSTNCSGLADSCQGSPGCDPTDGTCEF